MAEKYRNKLIEKIRIRRELKKSGKPKRPVNAFGWFVKDEHSKMTGKSQTSHDQNVSIIVNQFEKMIYNTKILYFVCFL
jgi:hypothetical protein